MRLLYIHAGAARSTQLHGLQHLRFFAAAMVLVGHLLDNLERGILGEAQSFDILRTFPWHSGVDVFFVISGFIMYFLMHERFGAKGVAWEFLLKRLVRIIPLYWIFTTLMLVAMLAFPEAVNNSDISLRHVLLSYLFIPAEAPSGQLTPILSVGWTLNLEMLFYIVFAISLLFKRWLGLAFIIGSLLALILIAQFASFAPAPFKVWGYPVVLEFLFGIAIAAAYTQGLRLVRWMRWPVIAAALALLVTFEAMGANEFSERWLFWGMPAAMIVAVTVFCEERPGRISTLLAYAGDASYALYLSHLFVIRAVGIGFDMVGIGHAGIFLFTGFTAAIAASLMIFWFIEQPLLTRLRPLVTARRRAGPT
ncbi:acyltransferase family protein [Oceanicaulis alexandrii]|uniref:acyltransferase family protein n=1 Tax=Oceanicaulis alexandrii TaxID=153233 RepID=UPI0023525832|nr:acyltransferase [Oceanicaulis alexandrii]